MINVVTWHNLRTLNATYMLQVCTEESFFRDWGDSRRTEMEGRCRRRKRGFERKEGEEKELWRGGGGVFLKRGAMLIWEKCKQHV